MTDLVDELPFHILFSDIVILFTFVMLRLLFKLLLC